MRDKLDKVIACLLLVVVMSVLFESCQQSTEVERFGSALLNPIVQIDRSIKFPDGSNAFELSNDISVSDCSFKLSNLNGQYATTWSSLDDYPRSEPLRPGAYVAEVFYSSLDDEGFDSPCLIGRALVDLVSGEEKQLPIVCSPANAVLSVDYTNSVRSIFSDIEVVIHTEGGNYLPYSIMETRDVYLRPGNVDLYVSLTTDSGKEVVFRAVSMMGLESATFYRVTVDAHVASDGVNELLFSFDKTMSVDDFTVRLTPEFLLSEAPVVSPIGFAHNETISVVEGKRPENNVGFNISGGNLSSLILNVNSTELQAKGMPEQVDLATVSSTELASLEALGLKIERDGNKITSVDVTDVIAYMRSSDKEQFLSLLAEGENGKISENVVLRVNIESVDVSVVKEPDMVVGSGFTDLVLYSNADLCVEDIAIEMLSTIGYKEWKSIEIVSIENDTQEPGNVALKLKVPTVKAGEVNIRVLYLGKEKAQTTLNVISPKFSFAVDAFAQLAYVKIQAETPELQELIASMANIYVNGALTQLVVRHSEDGVIVLGGLTENTAYNLRATLYDAPSKEEHFTSVVAVRTEMCEQLPNGNFEEVETGLVYSNLPAGGRYSQNIVDIYNQQNYVSYDLYMPKKWATVNAKTFCWAASNHNTWYMQPSTYTVTDVMEGAFAVAIESTSWDVDGEKIPDYRQTGTPYVNYNKNIPQISNRAAGRLFLGEYHFDPTTMTEKYIEGIEFASRPTSLNGYYKFVPCVSDITDSGIVLVEVIGMVEGKEIVISRTSHELPAAVGYTAFSVPLSYKQFGIKATGLKVMFASSKHYGTMEGESASVVTYSDVVTSTSHGGVLYVDNLTFSY